MRRLFAALVLLAVSPAPARAGVELTLAAGHRWGEAELVTEDPNAFVVCITTPCVTAAGFAGEDETLGLILDVPIARGWMFEALVHRQDGDLEFPGSPWLDDDYHSTTAQAGVQRYWQRERVTPFAALGLGVTRWETSAPLYEPPLLPGIVTRPVEEQAPSASLAAGIKTPLATRIGLRLEARYLSIDLPQEVDGSLAQAQASVGLSYRW